MARPSKSKKVLRLPSYQQFFAEGGRIQESVDFICGRI